MKLSRLASTTVRNHTSPRPSTLAKRFETASKAGAGARKCRPASRRRRIRLRLAWAGKVAEGRDDALVDRPLEGDDEVGQAIHALPAPGVEFGLAPGRVADVDLLVLSGEAEREPLLALPPEAASPGAPGDDGRKVVAVPFRRLGEELGRAHAGLLVELAERRLAGALAGVDAALRHLPGIGVRSLVGLSLGIPPPEEDETLPVQKHDSDAGAVGQLVKRARPPVPRHHRPSGP